MAILPKKENRSLHTIRINLVTGKNITEEKGTSIGSELTSPPVKISPPNKRSTESDIPVESRRKTEFTFTFSLKTSHGYGIFGAAPLTEFC